MTRAAQNEVRTLAYVLRRTNYGEADRILNLITPTGKMAVIAKGVRKPKSKLAGGVEMFSLADLNIHQGRGEFGIVTSAKMLRYFSAIVADLTKMELAGMILKRVSMAAENSDNPEFFTIVDQSLTGLNGGLDVTLVEVWFLINFLRASGEEMNLYRDANGGLLSAELRYRWDGQEMAFMPYENGEIGADEIKMMRLMASVELNTVARIKDPGAMLTKIRAIIA